MQEQLSPLKRYWKSRQQRRIAEEERYRSMTASQQVWSWFKTLLNAFVVVTIINGLALASMIVPTPSMESTVLAGENLFVNKAIFGPSTPQIIPLVNIPLPFYKAPALRDPRKGDIIVFIFPGRREQVQADEFTYYLKRCVAVAGDTLQVIDDNVYVNHQLSPLPPSGQHDPMCRFSPAGDEYDRSSTFPAGRHYSRSNYGPIRIPKKGDVVSLTPQNIQEWEVFIGREGHAVSARDGQILVDQKPTTTYTVERDYVFGMGDNRWNSLDSRYFGFIPKDNVVGTPMVVYWSMVNTLPDGSPMPLFQRFAHIRWSRLGKIIND